MRMPRWLCGMLQLHRVVRHDTPMPPIFQSRMMQRRYVCSRCGAEFMMLVEPGHNKWWHRT